MKPVRRTALQGEAIGDGEAIQGLGKGLDRSRECGTRRAIRAWCERVKRPRATKPVGTGAVACGACRSLEEVATSAGRRMPSI